MRAAISFALLLGLLTACGGGGGDLAPMNPQGTSVNTGQPTPQQQVEALLEECFAEQATDLVDLLQNLGVLMGTSTELPANLGISGFDAAANSISFAVDVDADEVDDVTGTVRFTDAAGDPAMSAVSFGLAVLGMLGSQDVATFLDALPPGTFVVLEFEGQGIFEASGSFTAPLDSSLPQAVDGEVTVGGGDCYAVYAFEDLDPFTLLGTKGYPVLTATVTVHTPDEDLQGTVQANGSAVAQVTIERNGESFVYEVNLDTGVVTPK